MVTQPTAGSSAFGSRPPFLRSRKPFLAFALAPMVFPSRTQHLPIMKQDKNKEGQEVPPAGGSGRQGAPAGNGTLDGSGNVDQIRQILFGNQIRDFEQRFSSQDERMSRDATELKEEFTRRLDALESFVKGEFEALGNRLRNEQNERSQGLEKGARDLAETARNLGEKLSGLDEETSKAIRDLRQQLLEQSKALGSEISAKHEAAKGGLAQEAREIRNAMAGREALAEMFSEISLRLKNEFQMPGGQS